MRVVRRCLLSVEAASAAGTRASLARAYSRTAAPTMAWLTAARDRQLAHFALSPEATRRPELRVAWTDGLLYDRLAGAPAASRPAPDVTELTSVVRRMLAAVLAA